MVQRFVMQWEVQLEQGWVSAEEMSRMKWRTLQRQQRLFVSSGQLHRYHSSEEFARVPFQDDKAQRDEKGEHHHAGKKLRTPTPVSHEKLKGEEEESERVNYT